LYKTCPFFIFAESYSQKEKEVIMIKILLDDGSSISLQEGLELPLEPLTGVKLVLIFESGLTVFATMPNVVGIVEEE
jgi:hypothetical protein